VTPFVRGEFSVPLILKLSFIFLRVDEVLLFGWICYYHCAEHFSLLFTKSCSRCCFGEADLATDNEQGPLQRSSSQRMNQPRQSQGIVYGAQHRHSYSAADEPRNNALQSYDLIDLSLDSEHSTASTGNAVVSLPPRIPMRDLITFWPGVCLRKLLLRTQFL